jgi:hypothetical protein
LVTSLVAWCRQHKLSRRFWCCFRNVCLLVNSQGRVSRHSANNCMLRGQPWRPELLVGIGPDMWPFIRMDDVVLEYMPWIHALNLALKPYVVRSVKRYECEILSKASLKSIDRMHSGCFECSVYAIASLTVAVATNIVFLCVPQCWLGCRSEVS